jgi:hypothetical protein
MTNWLQQQGPTIVLISDKTPNLQTGTLPGSRDRLLKWLAAAPLAHIRACNHRFPECKERDSQEGTALESRSGRFGDALFKSIG